MSEAAAESENRAENRNPPIAGRFQKGQSGNPGGRPKGLAKAVRDRLDAAAERTGSTGADLLIAFWAGVMADTKEDTGLRLKASQFLAERGWGKPAQFVPIEDDDPLEMSDREANEVAASFDDRLDEVAARRAAAAA